MLHDLPPPLSKGGTAVIVSYHPRNGNALSRKTSLAATNTVYADIAVIHSGVPLPFGSLCDYGEHASSKHASWNLAESGPVKPGLVDPQILIVRTSTATLT